MGVATRTPSSPNARFEGSEAVGKMTKIQSKTLGKVNDKNACHSPADNLQPTLGTFTNLRAKCGELANLSSIIEVHLLPNTNNTELLRPSDAHTAESRAYHILRGGRTPTRDSSWRTSEAVASNQNTFSSVSEGLVLQLRRHRRRHRRHIFYKMFAHQRRVIKDDRDKKIIQKNLDRYPRGYPWLAAYIDSDGYSVLFRRFGMLHARSLLYLEVELTDLEAKLDELDRGDAGAREANDNDAPNRWKIAHSIHLKNGAQNEVRKELMEKINQKLDAYDSLLLKDTQLRNLRRPSLRLHRNFLDTIYTEQAVGVDDQRFIYHRDDFVSLQQYEESWLDELMHRVIAILSKTPLKCLVVSPEDEGKTDDPYIQYHSATRLSVIIKIIIAFTSTVILLVPIYLFTILDCSAKLMAFVTLIFAFIFCAAVSTFTGAKRHEVFAATAAYCAVLVVFIGNLQQKKMDK